MDDQVSLGQRPSRDVCPVATCIIDMKASTDVAGRRKATFFRCA
jgi:hypothetical protein